MAVKLHFCNFTAADCRFYWVNRVQRLPLCIRLSLSHEDSNVLQNVALLLDEMSREREFSPLVAVKPGAVAWLK